jgi:hypothetical protein
MFFSKKKRMQAFATKQQQMIELRDFKAAVVSLMNGTHKLDKILQDIIDIGDVSHNTALFIMRTTQDLCSLVSIYKSTKYYHAYMTTQLTSITSQLNEMISKIESKSRDLIMIKENYSMTKQQLKNGAEGDLLDEDTVEDVSRKLFEMSLMIRELIFEIKTDYRDYRNALTLLRGMISNDYIAIISGIDIPLLYEDYETLVHNHMSQEVLFDIDTVRRELAPKEEIIHE